MRQYKRAEQKLCYQCQTVQVHFLLKKDSNLEEKLVILLDDTYFRVPNALLRGKLLVNIPKLRNHQSTSPSLNPNLSHLAFVSTTALWAFALKRILL